MTASTPTYRLQHILDSISKIESYWAGKSYPDFLADELRRSATERHLTIISEASRHISEADQTAYAHMPWSQIRVLGNILRHRYDRVEEKELWSIVEHDLAALKHVVEQLIEKNRAAEVKPV